LSARNRFLTVLGNGHSVAIAARHAGVSRNALYVRRRRDPHFALAWDAMCARSQALRLTEIRAVGPLSPALDGVPSPVTYAGAVIGTRVRKRSHRLFRLLTRLDQLDAAAAALLETPSQSRRLP
jgi:transposase-like protein